MPDDTVSAVNRYFELVKGEAYELKSLPIFE
jgi:hypothetical protein